MTDDEMYRLLVERARKSTLPKVDRGFWYYAVYFDAGMNAFRACPLEFCRAPHPIHVSGPTAEFTRRLADQVAKSLDIGGEDLDTSEMTNEQD